ncbi:Small nuclear ribonucleoprotein G [Neolecta irregularis DAH-3]|uniref:Small nuclear ribonucleoprotein G n=1 Tax=Neolecta irregularis (strain DAH-3) TaxID=1198029 RepID=A0A1U7LS01_NEOID|nr:Small nuclear ribonucleoprotein G [Neolecta irregularis DAH-3]|eukprot:OLL25437.1 Small nuclear ribonucleoprotein G [Neolecta irregularis DAH-3]
MSGVKVPQPELKKYMDKKIFVRVFLLALANFIDSVGRETKSHRHTTRLRRTPKNTAKPNEKLFLNIVLEDAVEEKDSGEKPKIGTVVIRGKSVVMIETLEKI